MEKKQNGKKLFPWWLKLVFLCLMISLLWGLGTYVLHRLYDGYEIPGQIGDSFGVFNSLFSGLAFCGLVYTIYVQHQDSIEQAKNFSRELSAIQRQRREAAFFTLLNIHLETVRNTKITPTKDWTFSGAEAFIYFFMRFQELVEPLPQLNVTVMPQYMGKYNELFAAVGVAFSQYLKSLLAIYKFVKNSRLKPEAEKKYLDLIKAYVTQQEKVFLFYHLTLISDANENRELKLMESELDLIRSLSDWDLANGVPLKNVGHHRGFIINYEIKYPLKA
ncbi:hypothetical protein KK083_21510 [Fulvivirgaceae bacterium PWU4]|uniref:Phage abortive infection protein n=1 Tax=Chryseosolibacter histidini TaxID=2782349 RepID=A0AAP2GQZ5_9BACT|nr:putative phage abortive infection protein [Chryseosolibacter histidini]MBT1699490.1 hypothetical protein [Chryseosolibacter histidini]